MQLRVNFKSGQAIHLQIIEQVKASAASGTLRVGEALPGIGPLAEELRVNRNSIAKAYSELEHLGVIETRPGQGYFLNEHHRPLRRGAQRSLPAEEPGQGIVKARTAHKTLISSSVAVFLGAMYLGLVAGLSMLIVRAGLVRGESLAVLATALVAAALLPLRSRVQQLANRFVFARRYKLPHALQLIKAEARSRPDPNSFMEGLIGRTATALGMRPDLIRDRSEVLSLIEALPSLRSARAPITAGADLFMPLYSDEEVLGVLRFAGKSSGQEYDIGDLEFLTEVGEQVAIAANQSRLRNERSESEYALEIQRGLLPPEIPQVPGFTIAGAWQPAKNVGGDYYDVFNIDKTQLALVVADVSGKGIPAALLMSSLQATAKAYATVEPSPLELCRRVNRAICSSIAGRKFITFFYAVLDWERRRLTYVNAGHNPPIVVSQNGTCRKLEIGGSVLGLFADGSYEQASIELLPGDRLIMFTDGITEAADPGGEEFGEDRLIALLRNNGTASAAELRDAIMQNVSQFCREDFADDATLLTVVANR